MDIAPRIGNRLLAGLGVACLAAALAATPGQAAAGESDAGYVVVLKGTGTAPAALAQRFGGRVGHTYTSVFSGYSATMTPSAAAKLAADPAVASVVPDSPVRAMGDQVNPPSWGLDRIDQRNLPLDGHYRYATEAENVTVYVLDTGVDAGHPDFGGRVSGGYDFVGNDADPADGNGHGTFMAGIIAGARYGVAKKARVVPVKVLDDNGSGSISGVIAGIDWITAHAQKPAVANMSLGGSANTTLDNAVRSSIASGVTYSVPSGSSASNAGNYSPARVSEALTSAATGANDCATSNSNYGPSVDLYAPGQSITGPWLGGGANTISGSSVAAAHTSGAAALVVALAPGASAAQVHAAVLANATTGVICNLPPNSPDRLLFTNP